MAIEQIKKFTVVSSASAAPRAMRAIYRLGVAEITEASERFQDAEGALAPREVSTDEADEKLYRIDYALNLLDALVPVKESFFEGLTPLPLVVEADEVDQTVKSFDLDAVFAEAKELDEVHRRAERTRADIQNQIQELIPLEDVPFDIRDLGRPTRVRLMMGTIPTKDLSLLGAGDAVWERMAWERVTSAHLLRKDVTLEQRKQAEAEELKATRVRVVVAYLNEDEDAAKKALASVDFAEILLPELRGKVRDRIRELKEDLAEREEEFIQIDVRAKKLAEFRRSLVILKAFWQGNRQRRQAACKNLQGKWVNVICGYVSVKDVPRLQEAIDREVGEAILILEDPAPGDDIPVKLDVPAFVRPIQLLVEMFGLPSYGAFDPSPFILINFFLFFGICFSDVGYGVMLVLMSVYLIRKTKPYRGIDNFARILFYGGCSTIVFGAVLGSWFGDLYQPNYLGEGNLLLTLQTKFVLLNPMDKTITALVIAFGIGMLNQFYGIALKTYGALKQGDWMTAFCDGLLWMVTLPGLVIMACRLFVPISPIAWNVGLCLFLGGALGLVLTQGRDAEGIVSKFFVGLISIYGIVGSYGCTAFIGDTLSYCRLLALGLTTSIVAQTFNMLAGMLREAPYVGSILFVVVLVAGHLFNFGISLLGAFVHSMRLIFVEFFGRFYEGGARPFQPLGFDSPLCIVKKQAGR